MNKRFCFASLAFALAGCSTFRGGESDRLARRRAELVTTHQRLTAALGRGDVIGGLSEAVAHAGFYVGALFAAGDQGRGPDGARAFLERDSLNRRSRGVLTVVRLDLSADGNDGYSYGYLDVVRPAGDTLFGQYKSYWRRRADGKWEALMLTRGRRERGAVNASAAIQFAPGPYRSWPGRDSLEARAGLRSTELAFSDSGKRSLAIAFKAFAAPDAAKISGATYVFGQDAVAQDFLRPPPPGFTGMMWSAEYGTVAGSGDLGFNAGRVFARPDSTGKQPPSGGLFVTIWRRQPNGEWKYLVD
jgi:ketosteroid isomerase-like protein